MYGGLRGVVEMSDDLIAKLTLELELLAAERDLPLCRKASEVILRYDEELSKAEQDVAMAIEAFRYIRKGSTSVGLNAIIDATLAKIEANS